MKIFKVLKVCSIDFPIGLMFVADKSSTRSKTAINTSPIKDSKKNSRKQKEPKWFNPNFIRLYCPKKKEFLSNVSISANRYCDFIPIKSHKPYVIVFVIDNSENIRSYLNPVLQTFLKDGGSRYLEIGYPRPGSKTFEPELFRYYQDEHLLLIDYIDAGAEIWIDLLRKILSFGINIINTSSDLRLKIFLICESHLSLWKTEDDDAGEKSPHCQYHELLDSIDRLFSFSKNDGISFWQETNRLQRPLGKKFYYEEGGPWAFQMRDYINSDTRALFNDLEACYDSCSTSSDTSVDDNSSDSSIEIITNSDKKPSSNIVTDVLSSNLDKENVIFKKAFSLPSWKEASDLIFNEYPMVFCTHYRSIEEAYSFRWYGVPKKSSGDSEKSGRKKK